MISKSVKQVRREVERGTHTHVHACTHLYTETKRDTQRKTHRYRRGDRLCPIGQLKRMPFLSPTELAGYNNHSISDRMIDRIFSAAVNRTNPSKIGHMCYQVIWGSVYASVGRWWTGGRGRWGNLLSGENVCLCVSMPSGS